MFAEVDEEEEEKDDNGEEEGKNNKEIDYKNRPVPSMKGLSRVVTLLQKQVKDSEERILEMLEKNLGFKNRRIDEIKRDVFQMTIELNKLNAEQQKKERQKAISERLATQPIFDDIVEKELNLILCELREMNFNLGEEITFQDLWSKYQALVNDKAITRASVVRVEAMGQYKALLTNLIEKELDGGNIDLIEKRNLKQPIQNFLSNQYVKQELKL